MHDGIHPNFDSRWITALSHPIRPKLLELILAEGATSASEASKSLGVSLNRVSYHLRKLQAAGLIKVKATVAVRGATKTIFRLAIAEDECADRLERICSPQHDRRMHLLVMAGQRFRAQREARNVTVATLAAQFGITTSYLERIEAGRADPPSSLLLALAASLNLPMSTVFVDSYASPI